MVGAHGNAPRKQAGNKTPRTGLLPIMVKRFIIVLLSACALAASGCTTEPGSLGPLVYTQQFSGNISTIVWPVGAARASLTDSYSPDFRWHRTDSTLDSLSGHHGQVVLVNFWATWCAYCKTEMPAIQAAAKEMGDSLFVIGVSDDAPGNPYNTVQSYLNGQNYTYQFAIDSDWTLYEDYFPNQDGVLPQCCFIDRNGKLIYTVTGEEDEDQVLYYARLTAQR
jgi:thiol-disulfide isomerase/thioredoxin